MITNALEGKPLPVYGDGRQVRDWLYAGDHCEAVRLVLEKGRPGEVYNVGGNAERRNLDVVLAVCTALEAHRPRTAANREVAGTALAGPEAGATMFLTGLCSLLDVILNRPLESILAEVNFPAEVKDALLGQPTLGRKVLDAIIAYEKADWDKATATAGSIGLSEDVLIQSYQQALPWIHTMARAGSGASA